MKYLVLKQMETERKLKMSEDLLTNDAESVTISRYFLSSHAKKARRFRSAFTTEQIQYLEREYRKFPYIGSGNRKEVSNVLNISEKAIKVWFQNRRMKEKKEITNKEQTDREDEEQKKINSVRQGQSNIQTFNHQPHSSQIYTARQSQHKPIYPDPSITRASIKQLNGNKNFLAFNESKSFQDKPRISVKSFTNGNFAETNNHRVVNKVAPVAFRPSNKTYVPMKKVQKNICTTKRTQELLLNQKEHGRVNQENPTDLTLESHSTQAVQPNFYQINPHQDHRYAPLHVQGLPQPLGGNILWKPVNMMPVLPGNAPPQVVAHNSFALIHPNFPKEDCKCNYGACNGSQEVPPLVQVDGRLLQPQYILAMPFNHRDRI